MLYGTDSSTMLALGTSAIDFQLPDVVSGQTVSLADFVDRKALLVLFISRHCPYVQHIKQELAKLGRDYQDQSLGIVAMSSNDPITHPDDAPESLKAFAEELSLTYPLLFDALPFVTHLQEHGTIADFESGFSKLEIYRHTSSQKSCYISVPS